ncbi:hypothetical protein ACLK1T_25205 [Escherichia coli]
MGRGNSDEKLENKCRINPDHRPGVPVIVVKKLEHAVPMAKALVAGGVRVWK